MRMSHTDVEIGATVAATDWAVVFGAGRRHREAGTLCARFAALGVWCIVTNEAGLAGCPRGTAALPGGSVGVARRLAFLPARSE